MFSWQFSDRAKFFSSCTSCGKANAVDSIMKTCWQFIAPRSWIQPLVDGDNATIKANELSSSSQVSSNTGTSYKNLLIRLDWPQAICDRQVQCIYELIMSPGSLDRLIILKARTAFPHWFSRTTSAVNSTQPFEKLHRRWHKVSSRNESHQSLRCVTLAH